MSRETVGWCWDHSTADSTTLLVLLAIANDASSEMGEAWPSMATIARRARCSTRTAQRCIERLVEMGELVVEPQMGGGMNWRGQSRHRPNLYTMVGYVGCQSVTPATAGGVTETAERGDKRGDRNGQSGVTLLSQEPTTEPENPIEPPLSVSPPPVSLFEEFYRAYPRRVGRPDAERAWFKATRDTDPSVILAAAKVYAADPNLPEMQFIPHPSRWLNDHRWEDGPLPPRRGRAPVNGTFATLQRARERGTS